MVGVPLVGTPGATNLMEALLLAGTLGATIFIIAVPLAGAPGATVTNLMLMTYTQ